MALRHEGLTERSWVAQGDPGPGRHIHFAVVRSYLRAVGRMHGPLLRAFGAFRLPHRDSCRFREQTGVVASLPL
jgi:hypothetical protein